MHALVDLPPLDSALVDLPPLDSAICQVRPNPGEGRQLMVYIAKEDETVTQIAKRLGMNAPEIISLNKNR